MLKRLRPGNVLLVVLMMISTIALVIISVGLVQAYQAQLTRAISANRRLQPALESAMRTMQEAAVSLASRRLGRLEPEDLDSLVAIVPTLTLPDPLVVDSFSITFGSPRVGFPVPAGTVPLWTTTDYPRDGWTQGVPLVGMRFDTLLPLRIRLAIRGDGIGRTAGELVLGVGQVAADQFAIQTDGPMEICTPSDSLVSVREFWSSGALLSTGYFDSSCNGVRRQHGPLLAADSLMRGGSGFDTIWTSLGAFGWNPSTVLSPSDFWTDFTGQLDASYSYVALLNATGAAAITRYRQSETRAGYGECADDVAACAGEGIFSPALTIQRQNDDIDNEVTVICGAALSVGECTAHQTSDAWSYYPRPVGAVPGQWQGLFPDPRREDRCTWASPRGNIRTFRCPTNSYGHVIRVGDAGGVPPASGLPPIPGGVVHILGSQANSGGPGDYSEVVVLRNAEKLTGPLHIVSRLPVFIEGSFNVTAPVQRAAITAPMITVSPEQTPVQAGVALSRDIPWALDRDSTATLLGWSSIWDSLTGLPATDPIRLDVPSAVLPQRLTAYTPVTINAVLRSTYEPTVNGVYRGGVAEQIPAVLGNFAHVWLTVNGTVYGEPAGGAWSGSFQPYGEEHSGLTVFQPKARYVIHNPLNAAWASAVPGSWSPDLYVGGSPGAGRPAARQARARGGASAVIMMSPLRKLPRGTV